MTCEFDGGNDVFNMRAQDIIRRRPAQLSAMGGNCGRGDARLVGAARPCPRAAGGDLHAASAGKRLRLKLTLLYYQCSAYDADVRAELARARAWVEQRAGQVVNPAIVLDIDETSLSNWAQIKRNNFGYIENGACDGDTQSACGQRDWVLSAAGVAIQPTLELFNAAKARNVAVFFITGRVDDPVQKAATEFNLRNVGYFGWDGLFMRDPKTGRRPVSEHKTAARIEIEQRGYTIIANVGDQESDLVNGHADMTFKVSNPFYFIE
jgi:predicted secreted acid phosphatase